MEKDLSHRKSHRKFQTQKKSSDPFFFHISPSPLYPRAHPPPGILPQGERRRELAVCRVVQWQLSIWSAVIIKEKAYSTKKH